MKTIAEILAHQFVGNHAADHEAFDKIYAFVEDEANSIADRAAALRHLAVEGMGLDGFDAGDGVPDEAYLNEYMKAL